MPRFIICSVLLVWLVCLVPTPEGEPLKVRLKTRTYDPKAEKSGKTVKSVRAASREGRQRLLVQFSRQLTGEELESLANNGARVLGYIPDQAYVISVPNAFTWEAFPVAAKSAITPSDKWSPQLDIPAALSDEREAEPVFYLVFFHEDVFTNDARDLALNLSLEVREHPNLSANHLLVQGPEAVIRSLTEYDEVQYILPASQDLAKGFPVSACENGVVGGFPLSPLAAASATGSGWAATARSPVTLGTTWGSLSGKLDPALTRAEIERAMAEWSRVVQVSFVAGESPSAKRNFHFLFGVRSHGDVYPFTGSTGVIAHAFFPSPPNPEPIAGDVHFNDDMPLRIGADIDLYSVALHELGHALGLPHTDSVNTVMYPYYRKATLLTEGDISNIRQLYLSTENAPPPSLRLTVTPPPVTTTDTTNLSGTVENGMLPIRVQWSNGRGGSGTVQADTARRWAVHNIPVATGANQLTLTATDTHSERIVQTVAVNRSDEAGSPEPAPAPSPAPAPAPPPEPTPAPASPPTLQVTSPGNNERTGAATIGLSGTASSAKGIRRVLWSSSVGSGQAEGSTQWRIPALPLARGANPITLVAEAADGGRTVATLTITRETSTDTSAPLLTVFSPIGSTTTTSNATVIVVGVANDAGGVAEVTWENSTGPRGTASGTTSWRAEVPVNPGFNTIIIRAHDQAGNSSWRSINVTRR